MRIGRQSIYKLLEARVCGRMDHYDDGSLLGFLGLLSAGTAHAYEEGLVHALDSVLTRQRISPEGINGGLYLAAKYKYFRCVAFLVREWGALFDGDTLNCLLHEDGSCEYTVDDVMDLVMAASQDHGLSGLDCGDTLLTLVGQPLSPAQEQNVIQLLPVIISGEQDDLMTMHQGTLNQALYDAAQHKLLHCVTHLVGEYNAYFEHSDALLRLLNANHNFTFKDAMRVKDAVAGGGGLDPNARDADGNTILHVYCARVREDASVRVDMRIVKKMVKWGVQLWIQNHGRETAYKVLMKMNHPTGVVGSRQFSQEETKEMIRIIRYLSSETAMQCSDHELMMRTFIAANNHHHDSDDEELINIM